ncbi:MAG: fatty acid desaturase, partial [Pseudomonadota bacterium]
MESEIDHKRLISNLSAKERRDLCAQSDKAGLVHLGMHLGLIACLGAAIALGLPGWQVLLLPQGVLLVFLFTALHETTHQTAFATDRFNIWTARLCAFVVFLGPDHFRYFHMAHHRFTHDPENDPELASPKPQTLRGYLIYLTGVPEWIWRIKTLVRNAAGRNRDVFVPKRGQKRVRTEARVALGLYALLFTGFSSTLLWVWLVPMLLGGPF